MSALFHLYLCGRIAAEWLINMRSIDRLEQQRRVKQQKRKNAPPPQTELEEEMELPTFTPLNLKKNTFDDSADRTFSGINTQKSIFDRTAVFHTDY